MTLSRFLAGSAERHVLIHEHVVADLTGFADDDAHAVIDKKAAPDFRTGMNFNTGHGTGELRGDPGQGEPASFIDSVRDAMNENGVESGVAEDDLQHATRGGVAFEDGIELFPDVGEHVRSYYRVIGWNSSRTD